MDESEMQLLEAIRRHATDTPEKIAVREVSGERALTYADLASRVAARAREFSSTLPRGMVVILNAPNTADFHIDFLAILSTGCSPFPFSADSVEPEVVAAAKRSRAAAVIGADHALRILNSDHAEPLPTLFLQTSGTTGHPGIVRRPIPTLDAVARNMIEAIDWTVTDHVLTSIPLTHSYGLEHGLIAPLTSGATVHLCRSFNLAMVLEQLSHNLITLFPAVPSIF
jgi:acyl-CoA synthetase (AMP-forming)/AMP-acid ligase II